MPKRRSDEEHNNISHFRSLVSNMLDYNFRAGAIFWNNDDVTQPGPVILSPEIDGGESCSSLPVAWRHHEVEIKLRV